MSDPNVPVDPVVVELVVEPTVTTTALKDRVNAAIDAAKAAGSNEEAKILEWIRDHLAAIEAMIAKAGNFNLTEEAKKLIGEVEAKVKG